MSDPNKTVFISYRRNVSKYLALMIFKDLQEHGYDVFLDVKKIDSGGWESVILNQIAARTHFVLLLTPGTLNRCVEPDDVLRKEIELAMELGRNIVPLFADKFDLKNDSGLLVGQLINLFKFNGMNLYDDMIDECLMKLRERFLKPPVHSPTLMPTPNHDLPQVKQIIAETTDQPNPTFEELSAEQYFSRAYAKAEKNDLDGAIKDYDKALEIRPDDYNAFYNRGILYITKGEVDAAIVDYEQAIKLNPNFTEAYYSLGIGHSTKGEIDAAIMDYEQAIKLNPNFAEAYHRLAKVHFNKGDTDAAITCLTRVIELKPASSSAYLDRGIVWYAKGEIDAAIADYEQSIKLNPSFVDGYINLGNIYYRRNEFELAKTYWSHALQIKPDITGYSNRGEVYFALREFKKALDDFKKANELGANHKFSLAGLAITHHALGNVKDANQLWGLLTAMNPKYADADWVKQELNWADPLVDEARKLIAGL